MERRPGSSRFLKLVKEGAKWWKLCGQLTSILKAGKIVSIAEVKHMFLDSQLRSYTSSSNYALVRFARALIVTHGCVFADLPEDWDVWMGMSKHVRTVCNKMCITEYAVAVRLRDGLRARLHDPQYSLADLIAFLCMANSVCEDDDA